MKKVALLAALAVTLFSAGCSALASVDPEKRAKAAEVVITAGMEVVEMIIRNGEPDMVAPVMAREPDAEKMRRYRYGDTIAITRNGRVVRVYERKQAGDDLQDI